MVRICIYDTTETREEMEFLLDEIQRLIRNGYTSGYYPHWELKFDEEADKVN